MIRELSPRTRKRTGRPPKKLELSYDMCAENTFRIAGWIIQEAERDWDTLSFDKKMELMTKLLPIALKRIPDKHEVVQIVLNASDQDLQTLINLADRNINLRKDLASSSSHEVKPLEIVVDKTDAP